MEKVEKNGIAVAGSVLVDKINEIKAYPQSGELTQIVGLEKAVGSCVPNVALDRGDGILILQKAKELGIKTSIDLVSENSDRYKLVLPCLPYTDYLIINENEAGKLTGIEPKDENLEKIAQKLIELGVKEKVVIHKPELAVCLSKDAYTIVPSYKLPEGYIQGTTGARDAFCAGTLIGIYEGWSDSEILEFGSACAVMALGKADATSGLVTKAEIKEYCMQKTGVDALAIAVSMA